LTQILISKKFEKEIVFESSVLAWIRNRIRIRIEQKCWIRIRNKSIRILNPAEDIPFFIFDYFIFSDGKLDCFGVAFAVVAGCQVLGFPDVHLGTYLICLY
jgi:hypothetical protein